MTSLTRKMKRARFRRNGQTWPTRQQPTIVHADGSYHTLRPTKGWIFISAARLRAQHRMAGLLS